MFTGYDQALLAMTHRAFRLYSISFLFSGFAIFGSAFFTALGDGLTSAFLSFMRTLFFQCLAVLLFPLIWGLDGIWFATAAADGLSVLIVALLLFVLRKKYHYAEA